MKVGIIGSGNIGSTLAGHLTRLGHEVHIANSRGPESLTAVAESTKAIPVLVEDVVKGRDLIIIAIPAKAISKLPENLLTASSAVIVDAGNYYPSRDGPNADIDGGLTDSEWVAKVIGCPVVKAFNNILAHSLATKITPSKTEGRIALSIAAEQEDQKQLVMKLVDDIGFDAIDGGALADSWRQQPGEASYCTELTKDALRIALQEADITKRLENRTIADEIARPYF